jgi:hypothetical protein
MAVRSSPARRRPKHREGKITGSGGQTPTPGAGPVAGTMDPVRPQIREQLIRDCASLDWSTDPHQTPSGGSRALTPDRSETPATGLCSKGIDTRGPVTEARNSHTADYSCKLASTELLSLVANYGTLYPPGLTRNSHTGEGSSTAWGANRRGMARTDKRVSVARVGSRMSNTASPAALMGCILTVRCLVRVRWQHVAIAHERGRIRSARDRRMTSLP